jgi:UDP-2,3-diacylglucosamine hydrolase
MTRTAVIAGTGALPALLVAALKEAGDDVLLAEMEGFPATVPGQPAIRFRLERLVPFLDHLVAQGVERVVMAGAVRRPKMEPELFDARTATLVPRLIAAMQLGDDGALREVIAILEDWDLTVVGVQDILPGLLPSAGIPTKAVPSTQHKADAGIGQETVDIMGCQDSGQACIVRAGSVIAREGPEGTDAMIAALDPLGKASGILFKAPKPGQDRRADLPVIGPRTALAAAEALLEGIVIEAGGVMVIDLPEVREILDGHGMFLWVRPRGSA